MVLRTIPPSFFLPDVPLPAARSIAYRPLRASRNPVSGSSPFGVAITNGRQKRNAIVWILNRQWVNDRQRPKLGVPRPLQISRNRSPLAATRQFKPFGRDHGKPMSGHSAYGRAWDKTAIPGCDCERRVSFDAVIRGCVLAGLRRATLVDLLLPTNIRLCVGRYKAAR